MSATFEDKTASVKAPTAPAMDPHVRSRLYVDMIRQATGRFPIWDPSDCKPVKVGDYGTIGSDSGRFERHGNIYEDPDITTAMDILLDPSSFPQTLPSAEDVVTYSESTTGRNLEPGVFASEAQLDEEACSDTPFEFNTATDRRGCFLIMRKAQKTILPSTVISMRKLAQQDKLEDMCLATEVTSCPSYLICLTDRCEGGLNHKVAHLGGSCTSGTDQNSSCWWMSRTSGGLFRNACNQEDQAKYTPLVRLMVLKPKCKEYYYKFSRRDSLPIEPKTDDDIWMNAYVSWRPLDDDGVEDAFEDTVFDD
ncbi:hypothetical protein FRB94_014773 [Tulasnella sp. JGI-2019a]|nr:hypothetical protein FRB93_002917 [Tulasnella sp. JGI-2019a]KAG9006938.1 hypothetical protein FRB94_014773 [Tulasnella sp. JGI-2019a]